MTEAEDRRNQKIAAADTSKELDAATVAAAYDGKPVGNLARVVRLASQCGYPPPPSPEASGRTARSLDANTQASIARVAKRAAVPYAVAEQAFLRQPVDPSDHARMRLADGEFKLRQEDALVAEIARAGTSNHGIARG